MKCDGIQQQEEGEEDNDRDVQSKETQTKKEMDTIVSFYFTA